MKVYLDTNVYCRPFDDQSQERIRLEAESFAKILELIKAGEISCSISDVLKLEMNKIADFFKRNRVKSYLSVCSDLIVETDEILNISEVIEEKCNIKSRDALHIASATIGRIDYFITCDDNVLKKQECLIQEITKMEGIEIKILDPAEFIRTLEGRFQKWGI